MKKNILLILALLIIPQTQTAGPIINLPVNLFNLFVNVFAGYKTCSEGYTWGKEINNQKTINHKRIALLVSTLLAASSGYKCLEEGPTINAFMFGTLAATGYAVSTFKSILDHQDQGQASTSLEEIQKSEDVVEEEEEEEPVNA